MENFIKISAIGLDDKDNTVIKSILKISPELQENFVCIGRHMYETADLIFVDADNQESLNTWHKLKSENPAISPIMMTKTNNLIENEITIHRPMVIQRVVAALESIVHKQLNNNANTEENSANKKILVVDDSFSVRKYMEQKLPSLHEKDLNMDFADSGKSAMAKIKMVAYDIVFLDVIMPGVDGYKVCKLIKSVRPKTRVVMLTSKKSPFDKVRGSMSGCDDYITKPPEDERLKKILID